MVRPRERSRHGREGDPPLAAFHADCVLCQGGDALRDTLIIRKRKRHPGGCCGAAGLAQVLARLRRSYARDTPGGIGSGIDAEAVGSAVAVCGALHIGTPHRRGAAGPATPGIDAGAAGSTAARRAIASARTGAEGQAAFGAAPNIEADAAGSAGAVSRACPGRTGRRRFWWRFLG
jgi:hypothetical protein